MEDTSEFNLLYISNNMPFFNIRGMFMQSESEEDPIGMALRVKEKHEDRLLKIPGVLGVGIGGTKKHPKIIISVREINDEVKKLPKKLDGIDVEIDVVGEVIAF